MLHASDFLLEVVDVAIRSESNFAVGLALLEFLLLLVQLRFGFVRSIRVGKSAIDLRDSRRRCLLYVVKLLCFCELLLRLGEFLFGVASLFGRSDRCTFFLTPVVGGFIRAVTRIFCSPFRLRHGSLIERADIAVDDLSDTVCIAVIVEPCDAQSPQSRQD